jgi:hypothetical protein
LLTLADGLALEKLDLLLGLDIIGVSLAQLVPKVASFTGIVFDP